MNTLLTLGGLVLAIFITLVIASEASHRTKTLNPYDNHTDEWTCNRVWVIGLTPITIIWLGVALTVLVAS